MSESAGSAGGAGGASGAGGAGGASGASGASESNAPSASDRSDVSAAASETSTADVDAQANAVAGTATNEVDSYETAATTDKTTEKTADKAAAQPAADHPAVTIDGTPAGTTHNVPSEGTLAEISRREDAKVEALADKLAAGSPTAAGLVSDFRAAGGQFTHSEKGGFYSAGPTPAIGIPAGTEQERMQVIAHELGHHDFRNNPANTYSPPGNPPGISDRQIEHARQRDYVVENANRRLANEGHATVINDRMAREYQAATGINIGVSGMRPGMPLDPTQPIDAQRRAIGDFYGTNLKTSTTNENYRSYYSQSYIDYYRDNFLPGR